MLSRRKFLKMTSASLAMMPLASPISSVESAAKQLPTRPIPSSGEPLPVLGFGQSAAFRKGDLALSTELLDILIGFGGRFVDTGGIQPAGPGTVHEPAQRTRGIILGNQCFQHGNR